MFCLGLLASSGEYWKRTRTFAIAALREFGFGKKSLETRVLEEVEVYLEALDNQRGEPYDIKQTTSIAISNIICSIVFGNRYEYSDKRFHRLMFLLNENLRLNSVSGAINLMPWLRHVPGDLFSYKALVNSIEQLRLFAQDHIAEHRRTFDEDNVNDVIDAFLKQQSKVKLDEEDTIFEGTIFNYGTVSEYCYVIIYSDNSIGIKCMYYHLHSGNDRPTYFVVRVRESLDSV